jgi:uncharacterized small protein (DUF1192 family)
MNDEVFNKKSAIDILNSEHLDQLSILELKERVRSLQDEIKRCNENIKNKELSKNAAENVFK